MLKNVHVHHPELTDKYLSTCCLSREDNIIYAIESSHTVVKVDNTTGTVERYTHFR